MVSDALKLVRRADMPQLSHTMVTLLAILLVLLIIVALLVGALVFLRHRRKARKALDLPMYNDKRLSTASTQSNHRRVAVRPSQSIHIYNEKQVLEDSQSSPPESPTSTLPEIRITFPEEVDASGKRQSGRVVVVHVGNTGVGLEPVTERLPAYQQSEGGRFDSVDLDRVGGLMEKETRPPLGWR